MNDASSAAPDPATAEQQARRQAERFGLDFEPLVGEGAEEALRAELPLETLVRFQCVPLGRRNGRLALAFGGLHDLLHVDECEFHLEQASEALRLTLVGDLASSLACGPR